MNHLNAAQMSQMLIAATADLDEGIPSEPTEGTKIARENRKVCNTLSESERRDLTDLAMRIACG